MHVLGLKFTYTVQGRKFSLAGLGLKPNITRDT